MKTRTGFVSNSSSSSFVILVKPPVSPSGLTAKEIVEAISEGTDRDVDWGCENYLSDLRSDLGCFEDDDDETASIKKRVEQLESLPEGYEVAVFSIERGAGSEIVDEILKLLARKELIEILDYWG